VIGIVYNRLPDWVPTMFRNQTIKKLSEAEFLEFSSGLDRRRINFDRGSLKGFIGDAGMNRDGGVTL